MMAAQDLSGLMVGQFDLTSIASRDLFAFFTQKYWAEPSLVNKHQCLFSGVQSLLYACAVIARIT